MDKGHIDNCEEICFRWKEKVKNLE
jgi:hypothetical protein